MNTPRPMMGDGDRPNASAHSAKVGDDPAALPYLDLIDL